MGLKDDPKVEEHIKPGMVVILVPDVVRNKMFNGCLMTITEVKDWGCQGYVQALGSKGEMGGQAYYRANWDEMEFIGFNGWVIGGGDESD